MSNERREWKPIDWAAWERKYPGGSQYHPADWLAWMVLMFAGGVAACCFIILVWIVASLTGIG